MHWCMEEGKLLLLVSDTLRLALLPRTRKVKILTHTLGDIVVGGKKYLDPAGGGGRKGSVKEY